jgi:hypothetical protein
MVTSLVILTKQDCSLTKRHSSDTRHDIRLADGNVAVHCVPDINHHIVGHCLKSTAVCALFYYCSLFLTFLQCIFVVSSIHPSHHPRIPPFPHRATVPVTTMGCTVHASHNFDIVHQVLYLYLPCRSLHPQKIDQVTI